MTKPTETMAEFIGRVRGYEGKATKGPWGWEEMSTDLSLAPPDDLHFIAQARTDLPEALARLERAISALKVIAHDPTYTRDDCPMSDDCPNCLAREYLNGEEGEGMDDGQG